MCSKRIPARRNLSLIGEDAARCDGPKKARVEPLLRAGLFIFQRAL